MRAAAALLAAFSVLASGLPLASAALSIGVNASPKDNLPLGSNTTVTVVTQLPAAQLSPATAALPVPPATPSLEVAIAAAAPRVTAATAAPTSAPPPPPHLSSPPPPPPVSPPPPSKQRPTAAPTKPKPTQPRPPTSCKAYGEYKARGGCSSCTAPDSPFIVSRGGDHRIHCARPGTLNDCSTECTDAILPAVAVSRVKPTIKLACIPADDKFVSIGLPLESRVVPFLKASTYVKTAFRLDLDNRPVADGHGRVVAVIEAQRGVQRLVVSFNTGRSRLRDKRGRMVKVTGVVSRGGIGSAGGPDWCIAAYLPVCK